MRPRYLFTYFLSKLPLKHVINFVTYLICMCIHKNNKVFVTSLHMYAFIYKIYTYTTLFIYWNHSDVNYILI